MLSVENGGAIATEIRVDHPQIVEISAGKMTFDGTGFNSAHSIINNLGYEFIFEINGNAESAVAEAVIINLGEEQLASIKLASITQKMHCRKDSVSVEPFSIAFNDLPF